MWQNTRTNLYHDHAECKYIRFPSDRISSLVNLWRGPRRSVFIGLRCRVHSTKDRSELEIRQTSMTVVIDENIMQLRVIDGAQNDSKNIPTPFKFPCVMWFA